MMDYLLILLYVFLGYQANMYLRRTLLGQVGVIYYNTGRYYVGQILWAVMLGWITIPVAIIVLIFKMIFSSKE